MAEEKKKRTDLMVMVIVYTIFIVVALALFFLAAICLLMTYHRVLDSEWRPSLVLGGGAIVLLIGAIFLVRIPRKIIKRVSFPNVLVIDRQGELIELLPGYNLIFPFFGFDQIYGEVPKGIQYGIDLFPGEEKKAIALKDGGKAVLTKPVLWIEIESPKQALGKAKEFERQLKEMAENRVGGTFNSLNYGEVMQMRTPAIMLKEDMRPEEQRERQKEKEITKEEITKKLDEIIEQSTAIQNFLKEIGGKYRGLTLKDIDFDEKTEEKRAQVIAAEMDVKISQNKSEATKEEATAIQKITKSLIDQGGFPPQNAQQIAAEMYRVHLVGNKGDLREYIWRGEGGTISQLAAQWTIGQGMGQELRPKKKEEKKKEKKEKIPDLEKVLEEIEKEEKK